MNFLLTAIVAVLVFGTVVLVHEAGHFFAARHCGIHVEEFSIGFGPALWSTVRGGTRYSVRLLPLGGYNNLAGETPEESEDPDEQERAEPAKKQDAAAASVHTYDPHAPLFPMTVDGKSFVEASPWQRFFVIAAGALMNFVLGFILLLVLVASGSAVTSKIIYDFQGENPKSQASGLQVNDEIMSVNRHFCFTAEDVMYELQRTENDTATITVLRDDKLVTLPQVQFDSTTNADGTTSMVLDFRVYGIEKTPRSVVHGAARYFCYYARVILRGFLDLFTGRVGVNELSGPVGIVNAVNEAVKYGWRDVLSLAAVITVNLGVFNPAASMWRNFPSGSARRCGAPSGAAPVIPCVCCRWAVTITLPVKPRKNLRTRTSRSGQNLRKSRMLPLLLCIPMIRMLPCSP